MVERGGLRAKLAVNCLPADAFTMGASDYEHFLAERWRLMTAKICDYFLSL